MKKPVDILVSGPSSLPAEIARYDSEQLTSWASQLALTASMHSEHASRLAVVASSNKDFVRVEYYTDLASRYGERAHAYRNAVDERQALIQGIEEFSLGFPPSQT